MVWYSCRRGLMELNAVAMTMASTVEVGTVMATSTKVFSTACKK